MANRRETMGQEGRYRRTASPSGGGGGSSEDPSGPVTMDPVALSPRDEFHQSLLQADKDGMGVGHDVGEDEAQTLSLGSGEK